jgi:hypothetical protein
MSGVGHIRKSVRLTIDGTAYDCAVTGVTLTPNVETKTTRTLCADGSGAVADVGSPTWSLDVNYLVDHNAASFYRFCVANVGRAAAFEYEPDPVNAAGVVYTGELRVLPGPAGGDADEWESGAVSMPVIGQPSIVDPVTEPETATA